MDIAFEVVGEAVALGLTFLPEWFGYFSFFPPGRVDGPVAGPVGREGKRIPMHLASRGLIVSVG